MNSFSAVIEWLNRPKQTREYKLAVEKEVGKGCWIDRWDDELCYVTLGKAREDFQKHQSAVLWFYKVGVGYVCRAKFFYDSPDTVCLGDIEIKKKRQEDKGYGSKVMSSLIKLCCQLKIKSISGEISERDSGHLNKLEHFYAKHGFKLTIYEPGEGRATMIGRVERELSSQSDS